MINLVSNCHVFLLVQNRMQSLIVADRYKLTVALIYGADYIGFFTSTVYINYWRNIYKKK